MRRRAIQLGDGPLALPALVGVMVLLDRSGSMRAIREPMERAFAGFLAAQRAIGDDGMWLTLHQFDAEEDGGTRRLRYEACYDRRPLAEVPPLALMPRGWTPLRDALWCFGQAAKAVIDDPADATDRLLLAIITDGEENSSYQHGWPAVRALLEGLEGPDRETVWMGTTEAILEARTAVPDFAASGATLAYRRTVAGTNYLSGGLTNAVTAYRSGHSARAATVLYEESAGTLSPADVIARLAAAARRTTGGQP